MKLEGEGKEACRVFQFELWLAGTAVLDHPAAGARFSVSLPSLRLVVPEKRHSTVCNTAIVQLGGLSVEGVSLEDVTFRSGLRFGIDSLSVEVKPEGAEQPIVFT